MGWRLVSLGPVQWHGAAFVARFQRNGGGKVGGGCGRDLPAGGPSGRVWLDGMAIRNLNCFQA